MVDCEHRCSVLTERLAQPLHRRLVAISAELRANFDPLKVYNANTLLVSYRLPRDVVRQLIEVSSRDLRHGTGRNFVLTPQTKLLTALRFYATGSFLVAVRDRLGLSKTSVSRSVEAVTNSLLKLLLQHIHFATNRDELAMI